ncbi:hypothetical protein [Mammaliicoccus sciuri]|uniref:hypothetical protein n=1 Tax=Mammaliicoccus sciuri TaxID=1296 RepID=UPI000E684CE3|nr:hypothetical protein [Mammaliicoccus sciuri]RIN92425.1 hypothetical protein BU003_02230 [Mammaliicoccus sciuri]RIN97160.1 hypothetical protein BU002_02240 [Mammaliicoccus sciuri]
MNEITIIEEVETNNFVDSSKEHNGGGYHQPKIIFEIAGKQGVFEDTSCGDFGTRFSVDWESKSASWGSMVEEDNTFSEFDHNDEIQEKIINHFDIPIFLNS